MVQEPTTPITDIGLTQLTQAYSDTLSCPKPGGGTLTMVWYCLNPTQAGAQPATEKATLEKLHIDCYMAQTGSGTEGTWKTIVTGTDTPNCLNDETFGPGGTVGSSGTAAQKTAANLSHIGLFENEVSSMVQHSSVWYNADYSSTGVNSTSKAAALYYYSFGKYSAQCPTNFCPGTTVGANTYKTAEGSVNNIAADQDHHPGYRWGAPGHLPDPPVPGERVQQHVHWHQRSRERGCTELHR